MGKVFSVHCSESFLSVVAEFVSNIFYNNTELNSIVAIVPSKEDVELLRSELKSYCTATVFVRIKIISLSDIDQDLLVNQHSSIKIISPIRKILLLMDFIRSWNFENNDNYPMSLSYELSALLNEMYIHCIPLSNLENLFDYDLPEHCQKAAKFLSALSRKWEKILCQEKVLDILEHRSLYLSNLIKYLEEETLNSSIVFAGIVFGNFFIDFIQALYKMHNSQIILPYIDVDISEKDWQLLDESHYQYYIKNLLDILKVNRRDIVFLGKKNRCIFIENIFNFNLFLEKYHKHGVEECDYNNRIELITCASDEEEAQNVSMVIKDNPCRDITVFTNNGMLSKRIDSILSSNDLSNQSSINYLIVSFILHILDVVISHWNPISLLSLLKHPFITLGYIKEDYEVLVSNFELKVIRLYSSYDFTSIENNIKENVPELLPFWEKIVSVMLPLTSVKSSVISSIVKVHMSCIYNLLEGSIIYGSSDHNRIEEFFNNFQNSCNGISIYGISLYNEILTSILRSSFFPENYKLSCINLSKRDIVIFAGFNEINYSISSSSILLNRWIRDKLGLASVQQEKGYFAYILYSFFYANKIYITQSLKSFGKVNEESIWVRKLKILAKLYNLEDLNHKNYLEVQDKFAIDKVKNSAYLRPQPNPEINERSRAFSILSVTSLETLVKNPYIFYLNNLLNILPCRDINEKFSMRNFGIVVHNILHKYVLSNRDKRRYEDLIEIAGEELLDKYKNFPHIETILWPKFQKIAEQFFEMNLDRDHYIDKVVTEHFFSWEIDNNVKVLSKCDRVEYLKDGSVVIIDYKTGVIPSQSDISSGTALQMIVQALTVKQSLKKDISGLMYWKISSEDMEIIPIDNYIEIMEKLEGALKQLIFEYITHKKPFIASYDVSKYTDYDLLIRVKEWGILSDI
ncbi:PD-(D/E)XK nuclease family protein [Ehrlichia sp. JZT12]